DLARMVMARGGERREPVWSDAAEMVLTAFIAFVAACEPEWRLRNLTSVKKLISSPGAYALAVRAMQQAEGYGGVIRLLGHQLTWFEGRELGAVITTVLRHTAWMDSPGMAARLSSPDFELRRLPIGRGAALLAPARGEMAFRRGLMRSWLGGLFGPRA